MTHTPNFLPHCARNFQTHGYFRESDFWKNFTLWTDAVTPTRMLSRRQVVFLRSADGGDDVHSPNAWLSRSSPNTGATAQPGQHGRYAATRLSCRTSTMTIPWRRRFFLQLAKVHPNLSVIPTSRSAWGSSATRCSSCKTQTLTSSTLPSQTSTWVCSNQYGSLVSGTANKTKHENIWLLTSTTRTGSQPRRPGRVSTHPKACVGSHSDISQQRWPK